MDIPTYLRHSKQTQAEFAERLGVSQGLVWQWLQTPPQTRITPRMALRIEDCTNRVIGREDLLPELYVGMTRKKSRYPAGRRKWPKRKNGSGK